MSSKAKYGAIVVGRFNGLIVIIAPYVEGRYAEEGRAYTVAKGGSKHRNRTLDANAEFGEETGIDLLKLGNSEYGTARIVARIAHAPVEYASNSGPVSLGLDVIVVENIGDLVPHLKKTPPEIARARAVQQGLPTVEFFLPRINEAAGTDFSSADEFDAWVLDRNNQDSIQTLLGEIRAEVEAQYHLNDHEGLKWDDKIFLGHYWQEGAVIIPLEEYLAAIAAFPNTNSRTAAYHASMAHKLAIVQAALADDRVQLALDGLAADQGIITKSGAEGYTAATTSEELTA
jgi:hypothetical protein